MSSIEIDLTDDFDEDNDKYTYGTGGLRNESV